NPGDAEVGHHRRVDLRRAPGFELAAASDDDEEIALASGCGRKDFGGLSGAEAVGGIASTGEDQQHEQSGERGAKPPLGLGRCGSGCGLLGSCGDGGAHLDAPVGAWTTTAAERSGMRCGSVFSSLKTAVKLFMGLPMGDDATGLENSKCAG